MLALDQLDLRYDGFALQADWAVPAGARVAVIGPSGAGKSTLLGAIGGFVAPHAGRLRLNGQDITAALPAQRGMAMLFQDGNLLPDLTLAQNVGLALSTRLALSAQDKTRVQDALARVGLAGQADARPAEISGGQQSRAALARVLLQHKPWLLLDEAFAALGPALRAEMLDLVAQVLGDTGAGLLMVTHSPEDARRIADLTVFVDDGTAHAPAPTGPLLDSPPKALRRYLG